MNTINIFTLVGSVIVNDKASKVLDDLKGKTREVEKNFSNFGDKIANSGKKLSEFGGKVADTGKGMTKKLTLPLAGISAGAIKVGMDFEAGMSKVAAVSQASGSDLERLTEKAREMGKSTSFSATEAAEGLEYMALAGWNTEQMLTGIEPILHLAEAGALDLGRASDLVTDSMAALGISVEDLEGKALDNYLDRVAQTAANSNTDIDALMEAMVRAGGTFERFNVPLEESNAFLGVLANRGTKGSEAGTALNAIMTRLGQTAGPAADALEELGINAYDSEGNFRGMEVVLKEVEGAMSSMTDKEKSHYTQQLAGLEHGKSFTKMLQGLGDEYDDLKDDIVNADGALTEMRDTMKDNLQGRLEEMGSALEEVGIILFDTLQPAVESVVEWITKAAEWFQELSPSMQKSIVIIGGIVAAIGPLLIVLGTLLSAVGKIMTFFKLLMPIIKSVGVAIGGISWPVVAVIAAIAALIAIGVALWKNWDKVKEVAGNVFGWIKDFIVNAFETVTGAISDALDWITDNVGGAFGDVAEVVKEYLNMAWDNIKLVWDFIKETFSNALDFVKALVSGDFEGMKDAIANQMEAAREFLYNIWENIKNFFGGKLSEILEDLKAKFQSMFEAIGEKLGLSKDFIADAWKYIEDTFKNALQFIKSLVTGDFEGMKEAMSKQMENAKGILSKIWNEIKRIISEKVQEVLGNVKSKFIEVKDRMLKPIEEARDKVNEFIQKIKDFFTKGATETSNVARDKFNEIKDRILTPIEKARDKVKEIVDKIKGFFDNMKLKIPEIGLPKLPKPKVDGGFDLSSLPPKVPKISWNAKGGIFNEPTIFDTKKGLQGVGEAGPEAIMPLDKLKTWIGEWMNVYRNSDGNVVSAIDRVGGVIKSSVSNPKEQQAKPAEYNVTFNIDGNWTVDSDERQRSVVEELSSEMEKYMRSRGEK